MVKYYVYVIGSYKKSRLTTYVGYAKNLKERINLHNRGKGAKFTRGRKWKMIYKEKYLTKSDVRSLKKINFHTNDLFCLFNRLLQRHKINNLCGIYK